MRHVITLIENDNCSILFWLKFFSYFTTNFSQHFSTLATRNSRCEFKDHKLTFLIKNLTDPDQLEPDGSLTITYHTGRHNQWTKSRTRLRRRIYLETKSIDLIRHPEDGLISFSAILRAYECHLRRKQPPATFVAELSLENGFVGLEKNTYNQYIKMALFYHFYRRFQKCVFFQKAVKIELNH